MSKQLYEDLLYKLKKANQERKLFIANKAGYGQISDYKSFLEAEINKFSETKTITKEKKSKTKPTIHIVDIVDCSGSMSGGKIRAALEGVNKSIRELKDIKGINYTYTNCNFSNKFDVKFPFLIQPLKDVYSIEFYTRGSTALYTSINETFDKLSTISNKDKVLVNIYTDGGDTDSSNSDRIKVAERIKDLNSKNYTITFIGTDHDVKHMIDNLNIDKSNTLSYDGTSLGLANSLQMNSMARTSYSASVVKGEDVSIGFYKNVIKK